LPAQQLTHIEYTRQRSGKLTRPLAVFSVRAAVPSPDGGETLPVGPGKLGEHLTCRIDGNLMSSPPIKKAKWIAGAAPDQCVVATAQLALASRLELVCYYLPLAAERWQEEVEYVHQLRVTTRRAVAALDIFGYLLSQRRRRWLRRRLNKIRRSAGDARDYDVQLARLEVWAREHPQPDVAPVANWLCQRRHAAQTAIVARYQKLIEKDFADRTQRLVDCVGQKVRPKELAKADFATAAQVALPPVVDDFFAAAGAHLGEIEALHRFRIESKRLRYAIELLAAAFPPPLRDEVYPVVETLQEKLGAVNDHATAAARYRQWARSAKTPAVGRLHDAMAPVSDVPVSLLLDWAGAEDAALARARAAFSDWWTDARAKQLRQQLRQLAGDH
jgi:CHAD domain-containing protein